MRKAKYIGIVLILFVGCAYGNLEKADPMLLNKIAYVNALDWYHSEAVSYKMWFKSADEETQNRWRENISPLFKKAKGALDMWKMFIDENELPDMKTLDEWKAVKTELLIWMSEIGG